MNSASVTGCWRCGADVTAVSQFCATCGAPQRAAGNAGAGSAPASWHAPSTDPVNELAAELIAATAGEYDILRPLGRGGQATVFLATELALGRRVAIKVMAPEVMSLPGMLERFYAEAVTQANLAHANIVAVYAVRRGDRLNFFTMQYVAGRSLQQAMRAALDAGRSIPFDVVRGILYQVGSALGYAHRRGVIHRDVKPGNVMLTPAGEAIVTDFGIAKVLTSDSLTMTGAIFGTASYMSPEQCSSERPTGASDQYSLGIVAYEMLTGAPPFSGNAFALLHAHMTQLPPAISLARPDCPPALEQAVMRMLAKRPADRFPDVGAALDAMGAGPVSQSGDDAIRLRLIDFAVGDVQSTSIDDLVRVPVSPPPPSRSGAGWARETGPARPPSPEVPPASPNPVVRVIPEPPLGASALFLPAAGAPDPAMREIEERAADVERVATVEDSAASGAEYAPSPAARPRSVGMWSVVGLAAVAAAVTAAIFLAPRLTSRSVALNAGADSAARAAREVPVQGPSDSMARVADSASIVIPSQVARNDESGSQTPRSRQTGTSTAVKSSQALRNNRSDSAGGPGTRGGASVPVAPGGDAAKNDARQASAGSPVVNSATELPAVVGDARKSVSTEEQPPRSEPRAPPDATPVLDALVERCHFALTSANEARLDELFGRGGNDATRDLRNALKAQPTVGAVSDKTILREDNAPAAEFAVAVSWHNNFGPTIRERYVIRASASLAGGAWQPLGCVVVSRSRLK